MWEWAMAHPYLFVIMCSVFAMALSDIFAKK